MKRKSTWFGVIGLFLTAALLGAFSQSGEDLFQKALRLERNEGKLMEAIELYNKVVAEGKSESLAAQAQLRIGLCYEKLGQKSVRQAQEAFQKVIDNFPGQTEAVKVAQEKLSNFLKAQSALEKAEKKFNIRKVWADPSTDTMGAPSPYGRYLSFVDWTTGDLAVRDLATGKNRRLTHKGSWTESSELALYSRWSPDGKKIVYNWLNKEECFELRIVELDDPKPRILYPVENMEYVHPFGWSPDGRNILVGVIRATNISQVGLISVADGSFRALKTSDDDWAGNLPLFTFSPDGKYIAFSFPQDEDTQNRDIFLMSVDDRHETLLIKHPMDDSLLGWSPDGKWILFASDRTGSTDAWAVRVDQGRQIRAPEMIKKDLGQIGPMGFTRDGSFFYGVSYLMTDIYKTAIDPDSGKILSPPEKVTLRYEGSNSFPSYSPDGKYVAYISTRGPGPLRRRILCIRNMLTGKERELHPELKRFNSPRWSPDSRFVSVEGEDSDEHFSIYRVDIQTGAVDPIVQVEPGVVIYSHRWSKDGQSIFYTRSDPDEKGPVNLRNSHIYIHDIVSGEDKILPGSPSDAKDIDISPDGQWLVLLNRDKKRDIRIILTSGGEPRTLYSFEQQEFPVIISPTWIAGGKFILFFQEKTDFESDATIWVGELMRISTKGGEPQALGLKMVEFRHFSVHPDGQQIVFHSRGSETERKWAEIWVIENFLPMNENKK